MFALSVPWLGSGWRWRSRCQAPSTHVLKLQPRAVELARSEWGSVARCAGLRPRARPCQGRCEVGTIDLWSPPEGAPTWTGIVCTALCSNRGGHFSTSDCSPFQACMETSSWTWEEALGAVTQQRMHRVWQLRTVRAAVCALQSNRSQLSPIRAARRPTITPACANRPLSAYLQCCLFLSCARRGTSASGYPGLLETAPMRRASGIQLLSRPMVARSQMHEGLEWQRQPRPIPIRGRL